MKSYLVTQWIKACGHIDKISNAPPIHRITDTFLVKAAIYLMRVLCFIGLIAITSSLGALAIVIGFLILPAAWAIIGIGIWITQIPVHQ